MKRIFSRVFGPITFLVVLSCFLSCFAISRAALLETTVFALRVRIVVLNLLALDKNTGQPLQDLRAEDFQVFEDGVPTGIAIFMKAPVRDLDPVALWLVAGCVRKGRHAKQRGRQVNGDELLGPALKQLNPEDMVGVAHWCAGKDVAQVDLEPTKDRAAPVAALNVVLGQQAAESHRPNSEQAIQKVLQLIHSETPSSSGAPLPVVVFLDSSTANGTEAEASQLSQDVLRHTSLVIDEINEDAVSGSKLISGDRIPVLDYLSRETGGQVLSLNENKAGEALQRIVAGLHARYVFAIFPPPGFGKWHTLRIELADSVIQKHPGAVVSYRYGYRVPALVEYNPVTERPVDAGHGTDSSLSHGLESDTEKGEIHFDADGAIYEDSSLARFAINLAGERLSWTTQADGNDLSKITVVTAFFSAQGEILQKKLQPYEVVRYRADSWTVRKQSFDFFVLSEVPGNADRVRILIRDDVSGKMGFHDLSMEQILKAPRLRAVIAEKLATGASDGRGL
jgi:hypothetical protein